jgi:hypothetical protein
MTEFPAERAIQEAIARGAFDDLPGAGKPLHLTASYDPDWWAKDLLRREGISSGALVSSTIALRREADGFPESLADLATEEAVRAVLADFNARVEADWRQPGIGKGAPVVARRVDVEEMVLAWASLKRGSVGT